MQPDAAVSPLGEKRHPAATNSRPREKGGGAGAQSRGGGAQALQGDAEGKGAGHRRDARRRRRRHRRRVSSVPHVPVFTSLVELPTSQPNGNIVAMLRLEV